MELFDIYDSNNLPLNIVKERGAVHRGGDWHRTSQIWIMNSQREILCNLRSSSKDLFPGFWDLSIGGHVSAGDTYEETAKRKLFEELGIDQKIEELIFITDERVEGADMDRNLLDREHARLFLHITGKKLMDFTIQKEEIERINFFTISDLKAMVHDLNNPNFKIVPIKKHYLKILEMLEVWPI